MPRLTTMDHPTLGPVSVTRDPRPDSAEIARTERTMDRFPYGGQPVRIEREGIQGWRRGPGHGCMPPKPASYRPSATEGFGQGMRDYTLDGTRWRCAVDGLGRKDAPPIKGRKRFGKL